MAKTKEGRSLGHGAKQKVAIQHFNAPLLPPSPLPNKKKWRKFLLFLFKGEKSEHGNDSKDTWVK